MHFLVGWGFGESLHKKIALTFMKQFEKQI